MAESMTITCNTTGSLPETIDPGSVRATLTPPEWYEGTVRIEMSAYEAARLLDCVSKWRPCESNDTGREVAVSRIEAALRRALPKERHPKGMEPFQCAKCAKKNQRGKR